MLLLENFVEQNELRKILIKKYGESEKNIKMLVVHQILLTKLSVISKKKQKKLLFERLFEEIKIFIIRLHTHLQARNSASYLSIK